MSYLECVGCSQPFLAGDIAGHLRGTHQAIIDYGVLNGGGADEATVIQELTGLCKSTLQGPVPQLTALGSQRVDTTRATRLNLTGNFGHQKLSIVGSGDALSELEIKAVIDELGIAANFPLDVDNLIAGLIVFYVGNDASPQNDEGGINVISAPIQVVGAPIGTTKRSTDFLTNASINAAGKVALNKYGRSFTPRRFARGLYPIAYQYRTSAVFANLNAEGTARTRNWGWSPSQWYLTVSWTYGVAFTSSEAALLVKAAKLIGPVDASPAEQTLDSTPQSLQDAEARNAYQNLLDGLKQ